jgi:hypothetical protein
VQMPINVGLPGHAVLITAAPSDEGAPKTVRAGADRGVDETTRQLEDWVRRRRDHRHEDVRRSTLGRVTS